VCTIETGLLTFSVCLSRSGLLSNLPCHRFFVFLFLCFCFTHTTSIVSEKRQPHRPAKRLICEVKRNGCPRVPETCVQICFESKRGSKG
jgi:hypothetical protein